MPTMPVDDGELSYELRGSGPPVVLLHAGMLDSRMWDAQVELLAPRRTVVRYDARGHGRSSTPTGPFRPHEDLRQLMVGLGIPRAALVGLSGGARIAADFAISHPDQVDRLLLAAPGLSAMAHHDPFVLDQLDRIRTAASAHDLPGVVECILRMWVDGPLRAPDEVPAALRETCRVMYSDTLTRHGFAMALADELTAVERAAEVVAPTLLMVGDQDSPDIHGIVELLAGAAPSAKSLVFPGAGHMLNLEVPQAFDDALIEFLGL
jgi:3-oxoadipate enol-lactonase